MAFRHDEICDQCDRPVTRDQMGSREWYGLRFSLYDAEGKPSTDMIRLPGTHGFWEHSDPIQVSVAEHVKTMSGYASKRLGLVLPGVVCSRACFVAWMTDQLENFMKEASPGNDPVTPGKRQIDVQPVATDPA